MLAEAIRSIEMLATKAAALSTHAVPNDPERLLLAQNGQHEVIPVPFVPPKRRYVAETFAAFGQAYETYGSQPIAADAPGELSESTEVSTRLASAHAPLETVWIDQGGLLFYFDETDRRERCVLRFDATEVWLTVEKLRAPVSLEHKALVRLLRHDLASVVDPAILAAFRTLDFEAMTRAISMQAHGKQSLDAQVTAQVLGSDKPEGFTARLPVFRNPELRPYLVTVGITVDIDAAAKRITLQTVPDSLDIALDDSLENAASRIEHDLPAGVVVLRGTPE